MILCKPKNSIGGVKMYSEKTNEKSENEPSPRQDRGVSGGAFFSLRSHFRKTLVAHTLVLACVISYILFHSLDFLHSL